MELPIKSRTGRVWLGVVLIAAVAVPCGLSTVRGADSATGSDAEWPIVEIMEGAQDHYRILRRESRRQNFSEETIERVVDLQHRMMRARHLKVPMAERLSGTDRDQMYIGFKKKMAELITELMDLEVALLEGRNDDAVEHITRVVEIRAEGHQNFTEDGL